MNIDMTRHQGATGISVAECIDKRFGTWRVRTDMQPSVDEETGEQTGVTFIETEFPYKPTLQEVREFVLGVINQRITDRIVGGMTWQGKPVWLSIENQLNFSQAVAPCTLKIGETTDSISINETFDTAEALKSFWDACLAWKDKCLSDGRAEKDNFDFTPYEEALKD